MSITRGTVLRGPAVIQVGNSSPKTIRTAGDIKVNMQLDTFDIPSSEYGNIDQRRNNVKIELTFQPVGTVDADTIVTVTGSNPEGVGIAMVKKFVKELKKKGAKIVIDSRSFSLADIIEVKPYLIKPNKDEIAGYIGRELKNLDEIAPVAEEIRQTGVENVLISAGGEGAVFACRRGVFTATVPKINAVSTIGAGDSTVAGFLAAIVSGEEPVEAFRNAVATGTAACCEEGTNPPKADLVKQIKQKVTLQKV